MFYLSFKTQIKGQLLFETFLDFSQAELITLSSAISQLTYAFIKQLFIEFSREYTRHSGERNGYLDGYFTVSVLE